MPSNATDLPRHPYYPVHLEIPQYLPNQRDPMALVSIFATGCTAIASLTYLLVMRIRPRISTADLWAVLWFVLCGCIHLSFGGYYAYNFRRMPMMQDVLGQLWKEYSLADSRYQTQDAFVLCVECITAACWGPWSLILAAMIATDHSWRYPLQAVVSWAQLYADVLYYATRLFDFYMLGLEYSRPEKRIFFMNPLCIVIPGILLYDSVKATGRAFSALEKIEKTLMTNSNGICHRVGLSK
ncbi:hypothetical protein DSL72_001166 [Monilinia vaccinii-corymbosi]|uniref:EXPERA domain-containing protein n=1 Tax=Monilinia vaccinii-corymbosi TaxID=61207 RepID=A0A8A3P9Y6_9HELO|nr:hypothetical protein DSL72_001166 [Monilinia vaccinii-corymbosi]